MTDKYPMFERQFFRYFMLILTILRLRKLFKLCKWLLSRRSNIRVKMILSVLNSLLKKRPLLVSMISNTIKTAGADFVAQHLIEGKDEIDYKRVAVFASFGLTYLGGWQYVLFNKMFPRLEMMMARAHWQKTSRAATLTFLDMGIHTPFMYFPAFYSVKNIVDGGDLAKGIKDYRSNMQSDLIAMWQVWIPAQMINFAFVPLYLRMPFIAGVSFAWTVILSITRG